MKKLLLGLLLLSTFGSYAQVKKVILHDYTGAKCQYCTDGTLKIETMLTANPNTFIPVQIHAPSYTPSTSALKTAEGDAIDAAADPAGYPAGSVDMLKYTPSGSTGIAMSRTYWDAAFQVQKVKPAIASVSINNRKKSGTTTITYEADVIIEFNTLPTAGVPVKWNVFLVEDSIKADGADYTQTNYSGGPHGGASPLTFTTHGYVHNNALRKTLKGTWGAAVDTGAIVTSKKYTHHITFTYATGTPPIGNVAKNMRIIAFVAYDGATNKEVINGEMLSVSKTFYPTGVQNLENVTIMSAYPNPAKLGEVVNVYFDIKNDELVTMNVYSITGQKVATPYVSNDIAGGHFIQWKTGLDKLTPGTYIIELATPSGKHTQQIVLQ